MERWIKELERNTSKRKAMRKMRKIVRLKIDDGLSFADIASMLSIPIEDIRWVFCHAVDGVDFGTDLLTDDGMSESGPVPTNNLTDNDRSVMLSGSTVEILILEIDEFSRENRRLSFRLGDIRYNGAEFVMEVYIEGEV